VTGPLDKASADTARPNIFTAIAYDEGMNLGAAYNRFMERIPEDAWGCFLDHDAMFTTIDWYPQLVDVIAHNPKAGLITALTNRIGNPHQVSQCDGHDVRAHRQHGKKLKARYHSSVLDLSALRPPISGVLICISRKAWLQAGKFREGFFGVDNQIHLDIVRAGYQVLLAKGLYVYHWYRADGDQRHVLRVPERLRVKPQ
jgi:GT2 family glycosyltransferase